MASLIDQTMECFVNELLTDYSIDKTNPNNRAQVRRILTNIN